ncbi:MAG TPA: trehalose-6-phosphate synthase, partial [Acidobacteriaceae bacterium]
MRILSLRLIVALIVGVTLVSFASSWSQVSAEKEALRRDLDRKAEAFNDSMASNAEYFLQNGDRPGLVRMIDRFSNRDHLLGLGIYDRQFFPLAVPKDLSADLPAARIILAEAMTRNHSESTSTRVEFKRVYMVAT